jgi:hypothetical protein
MEEILAASWNLVRQCTVLSSGMVQRSLTVWPASSRLRISAEEVRSYFQAETPLYLDRPGGL